MPSTRSNRQESSQNNNEEIIFGKHAVRSYLQENNEINKILFQKPLQYSNFRDILHMVKQQGIVYQEVPKAKLDDLTSDANHQGVVALIPPHDYASMEDIFALAEERQEDPFVLILDGIEDPHNLGSIIRTADAVGVHGVIIPKRRASGLTGIVAKTSTGAINHVPVVRVTNLSQAIDQLKAAGVWVFATAMDGEDMRQWNTEGPIAVIIGNEGQGVSQKLIAASDGLVTIPMVGHVQSLNASVATAVISYEIARHRID